MQLQQEITFNWLDKRLGSDAEILIESVVSDNLARGRSRAEAPEVDGEIFVESGDFSIGSIIPTCLVSRDGYDLIARTK